MKKRSLVIGALAAMVTAGVLAGCGTTYYFAGRALPPSRIANRVLIAIQNPTPSSKGSLEIVDAYYDIRQSFDDKTPTFFIGGYAGALPTTIQNMPEEQIGVVYGSGDGSFKSINYQKETQIGSAATFTGLSTSAFISRDQRLAVAADLQAHVVTVVDSTYGKAYALGLPGVYRVSMNTGGTVVLAFVQNSNYAYYPRRLQATESTALAAYYLANQSWPAPYEDCEPKNLPGMCLAQVQSPDNFNSSINAYYGAPISFDRPIKAVFSADGSNAFVLNCGPECGGSKAGVAVLPVAALNIQSGLQSGAVPTQSALKVIAVPGGASNALEDGSTLYVYGQQLMPDSHFAGHLTQVDLVANTAGSAIAVSDATPGQPTKMLLADDNTLWLGGVRCTEGERFATGQPYGCLTMFNTATNTTTMVEPYLGDLTGIAAIISLHKVYVAEGGQVYIYNTRDGTSINNYFITVQGTASDVAYMDALTDADNTDY